VKNVDIHALDRQVQWSLSRFSLSLEVCTCFYKLKPRASCVHNFEPNSEGRQKPHFRAWSGIGEQKRMGIRNAPV